jgi:glycosyltransferase involved in cell wall biosynthesis
VGSIAEVVRDGENGFCVDVGNGAALTEVIDRLLAEDGEPRGDLCRQSVAPYDISRIGALYGRLFVEAVAEGARSVSAV